MSADFMFTSESVTEGHPDKLCDQISDAIVDRFLQRDPFSRIIAECAVSTAIVFIAARFSSRASVDVTHVAREVINQIGYDQRAFNSKTCSILTSLRERPAAEGDFFDERNLSDQDMDRVTARDHVNVFGYACSQTAAYLPLPIWLAHKLARRVASVRLHKILPYLAPDGKTQVGVEYRDRKPYRIHSITVITSQRDGEEPPPKRLTEDVIENVVNPVFSDEGTQPDSNTQIFVNPDGPVVVGGPAIHSGLTGRKNAIDTYGEYARHSGAALSGKDPTRIDRIGAYAARYAAKNVVVAGLADECEVQLSYTIGLARPVSIQVQTFGTGRLPDDRIAALVEAHFDFRLAAIIRHFNLRHLPSTIKGGFYRRLAAYGHVGRMDIGAPWEVTDRARLLREAGLS
jgi:S-adenosylmethionine synthetase